MGRQGREAARGPAVLSVPVANHPSRPVQQEAPFRAGSANGAEVLPLSAKSLGLSTKAG